VHVVKPKIDFMKKINLSMVLSFSLLIGCSDDKPDSFETPISGYYKITSIGSSMEVDMNNDGIRSKNLFKEISDLHQTSDNQLLSFCDLESSRNFMEIRPLPNQTNNAQLISLNIPDQRIDSLISGEFYLGEYLRSFINYSYKLSERSNEIELINNNPEYKENGVLNHFEIQIDGSLKLQMTKKLFDFKGSEWVPADVTIIYKKVD
jgi:hypothetical protein